MDPIIVTLAAALATTFGGLASSILGRQKKASKEEAEQITTALQLLEGERRAIAIEKATERLPTALDPGQLAQLSKDFALELRAQLRSDNTTGAAVESLVKGYHAQALGQARAQFWFSILAATVGFGLIIYYALRIDPNQLSTVLGVLPGTVMDAVAFLFFKQASETRQRATELYDRLRKDKQSAEAVALVSSIDDVRVRSAVKAQLALHMSGLQPREIELSTFLSRESMANVSTQHTTITSSDARQSLLFPPVATHTDRDFNLDDIQITDIELARSSDPKISYKLKLRLGFRNDRNETIVVRSPTWEAEPGGVKIQLPAASSLQLWSNDKWGAERAEIRVEPAGMFRTWIGLDPTVDDNELALRRESKTLGLLRLPIVCNDESLVFERQL